MPRPQHRQDIYRYIAGPLGHLEGITVSDASNNQHLCHYFGGVPYALPPIGPYRFRRPRPLPAYYRYGTKANPGQFKGKAAYCPQPPRFKDLDKSLFDEDCLQLNVYIPAGKKRPVEGWPVFFVSTCYRPVCTVFVTRIYYCPLVYPWWLPTMGNAQ